MYGNGLQREPACRADADRNGRSAVLHKGRSVAVYLINASIHSGHPIAVRPYAVELGRDRFSQ